MNSLQRIGVIGTGLIGGSIGLRARSRSVEVLGCDRRSDAVAQAVERGCIDRECARDDLYRTCDVVVLAMPPRAVLAELETLEREGTPGNPVILDVASVKAPIAEAARGIASFVGSHPMAGNEGSGPTAADAELFEGRTWAYVRAEDERATRRALEFIALMGAQPLPIEPHAHDAAVALTSHVPQIFASLFVQRLRESQNPAMQALCGPVARELLRIGSDVPEFWNDVLAMNAKNVAHEVRALSEALERYILNTP